MRINVIMYHYVRDLKHSRYPGIKGLEIESFRRQLEFLKTNFNIIRMENMISSILYGEKLPDNAALLTFDDGYIDHYTTVFPLLDEFCIQGSFFIPSNILEYHTLLYVNKIHLILASNDIEIIYQALLKEIRIHRGIEFEIPDEEILIATHALPSRFDSRHVVFIKRMLQDVLPERLRRIIADKLFIQFVDVNERVLANELYCNIMQLKTMKKNGMFFGLHGSEHVWLGNMEEHDFKKDIIHALDYLDSLDLIDKSSWVMNYPYGSWSDDVVDFIRSNGCLAGLTTSVGVANLELHNRFLLPRLDTNDYFPISDNYLNF